MFGKAAMPERQQIPDPSTPPPAQSHRRIQALLSEIKGKITQIDTRDREPTGFLSCKRQGPITTKFPPGVPGGGVGSPLPPSAARGGPRGGLQHRRATSAGKEGWEAGKRLCRPAAIRAWLATLRSIQTGAGRPSTSPSLPSGCLSTGLGARLERSPVAGRGSARFASSPAQVPLGKRPAASSLCAPLLRSGSGVHGGEGVFYCKAAVGSPAQSPPPLPPILGSVFFSLSPDRGAAAVRTCFPLAVRLVHPPGFSMTQRRPSWKVCKSGGGQSPSLGSDRRRSEVLGCPLQAARPRTLRAQF